MKRILPVRTKLGLSWQGSDDMVEWGLVVIRGSSRRELRGWIRIPSWPEEVSLRVSLYGCSGAGGWVGHSSAAGVIRCKH